MYEYDSVVFCPFYTVRLRITPPSPHPAMLVTDNRTYAPNYPEPPEYPGFAYTFPKSCEPHAGGAVTAELVAVNSTTGEEAVLATATGPTLLYEAGTIADFEFKRIPYFQDIPEGTSRNIEVDGSKFPCPVTLGVEFDFANSSASISPDDISFPSSVTLDENGNGVITITAVDDDEPEGIEGYFWLLVSYGGESVSVGPFYIPASDQPVYSVTTDKAVYLEGQAVTVTATVDNYVANTSVYWAVDFLTAGSADFSPTTSGVFSSENSGSVVLTGGTTTLFRPEYNGSRDFRIRLYLDPNVSSDVAYSETRSIVDWPPTYSLSADSLSVNEGNAAGFTMTTTNVPDGRSIKWRVLHGTTQAGDFAATWGYFTISGNSGSFSVGTVVDGQSEGAENFRVRAEYPVGTVVATSPDVWINASYDTSTPCGGVATQSGGAGVTENFFSMPSEGGTVTFAYDAYNIPDKFDIYYGGSFITTYYVSGSGTLNFYKSAGITLVRVVVTGSSGNTQWEYQISCPGNPLP